MILGTLTPNHYAAPWPFVASLLNVHREYQLTIIQGPYIAGNRNELLKKAKEIGTSILMIDSDMVFTLEDVRKMEKHLEKYDVVTGLYMKGDGSGPALFYLDDDVEQSFFEIKACGAGFLGISKEMVEKLPDNAFDVLPHTDGGEDVSFCERVRELGGKIYCDKDINVGHLRYTTLYGR